MKYVTNNVLLHETLGDQTTARRQGATRCPDFIVKPAGFEIIVKRGLIEKEIELLSTPSL